MTEPSVQNKYADQANLASGQFSLFFVGLTFSILALSVQHPVETDNPFIKVFELVGWIVLMVSGILGLRHFEWRQVNFSQMAHAVSNEFTEEKKNEAVAKAIKTNNKQIFLAMWQRRLFYIGIGALMVARGWGHVVFIYCYLQG